MFVSGKEPNETAIGSHALKQQILFALSQTEGISRRRVKKFQTGSYGLSQHGSGKASIDFPQAKRSEDEFHVDLFVNWQLVPVDNAC